MGLHGTARGGSRRLVGFHGGPWNFHGHVRGSAWKCPWRYMEMFEGGSMNMSMEVFVEAVRYWLHLFHNPFGAKQKYGRKGYTASSVILA